MATRITRATIKSFIKKYMAEDNLYIMKKSEFSGWTDGVEIIENQKFKKAVAPKDISRRDQNNELQKIAGADDHNLGVEGLWLVGSSRDYFDFYEDNQFRGYSIYNSCGSSVIAFAK